MTGSAIPRAITVAPNDAFTVPFPPSRPRSFPSGAGRVALRQQRLLAAGVPGGGRSRAGRSGRRRRPRRRIPSIKQGGVRLQSPHPGRREPGAKEERPMARPLARDAEDFARLMLQTTERLGRDGGWVRATDAFERTLSEHPDHPWVAQVREKPTRRIALSAAVERLRVAEFPHIERRKTGNRRNAPVSYRI